MQKVIVTGGAGFIGSHLVRKLSSDKDCQTVVIDDLRNIDKDVGPSPKQTGLKHSVMYYKADLRNRDLIMSIFKRERADTCVHLAANINVDNSFLDPYDMIDANVVGTFNVLEACSEYETSNFVLTSSAAVYGEGTESHISENHVLNPLSPYGASKLAAESLVSAYSLSKKVRNAIVLRLFNVYGEEQHSVPGVIGKFAGRLAKNLPPIIYGDGTQVRDFISVQDVVNSIITSLKVQQKGILLDASSSTSFCSQVFNIGTGIPTGIDSLANKMIQLSGLTIQPVYEEKGAFAEINYSCANTHKARDHLNFKANSKLEIFLQQLLGRKTK